MVEVSATGTVEGEKRNRILDKTMQLLSTGGSDWQYRLQTAGQPEKASQKMLHLVS